MSQWASHRPVCKLSAQDVQLRRTSLVLRMVSLYTLVPVGRKIGPCSQSALSRGMVDVYDSVGPGVEETEGGWKAVLDDQRKLREVENQLCMGTSEREETGT